MPNVLSDSKTNLFTFLRTIMIRLMSMFLKAERQVLERDI